MRVLLFAASPEHVRGAGAAVNLGAGNGAGSVSHGNRFERGREILLLPLRCSAHHTVATVCRHHAHQIVLLVLLLSTLDTSLCFIWATFDQLRQI